MRLSTAFALGELNGEVAAHRRTIAFIDRIRERLDAAKTDADVRLDRKTVDALLVSILGTMSLGASRRADLAGEEFRDLLGDLKPDDRSLALRLAGRSEAETVGDGRTNAKNTGTKP